MPSGIISIKCEKCGYINCFTDRNNVIHSLLRLEKSHMIFCKKCEYLIKITSKNCDTWEKIIQEREKMKIGDVKEEEIRTTAGLPEQISFNLEDIQKADFEHRELTDKTGDKYMRWIMKHGDIEFSIANTVMQAFKKMPEKEAKEIEIIKKGVGLATTYEITYSK